MSRTIQIRDIPDDLHRRLKAQAAEEGMSLSDFIKRELLRNIERPTMQEWLERAQQTEPLSVNRTFAELIRELRDSR